MVEGESKGATSPSLLPYQLQCRYRTGPSTLRARYMVTVMLTSPATVGLWARGRRSTDHTGGRIDVERGRPERWRW